jgi:hypothetical protein
LIGMLEVRNFGKALERVTPLARHRSIGENNPNERPDCTPSRCCHRGSLSGTPISASLAALGASIVAPDLIGYGRPPPPGSYYGIAESNSEMRDRPMEDRLS